MTQIFASERGMTAKRPSTSPRATRGTAPETALAALQARADLSGPTAQLAQLQQMENAALQRMAEDEEMLQGRFAGTSTLQRQTDQPAPAQGGLPGHLQQGIEALSGADMSGVSVHYNSSQPAQVGAHAYAQGSDIHLASGQERHLPHEAWHVVQQQEGRVAATTDVAGTPVNDDAGLEKEADMMGAKAAQFVARNRQR
ncbi:eCIS core domain-containing protein [Roseobacter weihaiensis]|uniref:eCIS core domain-containing protein n=1 Tax=Roseobacter weihaiensis TaxID=2763262 RepID=UPI001D0AA374|nr:DUF4157 domain-containing protein [Roseobacter sp. H9]